MIRLCVLADLLDIELGLLKLEKGLSQMRIQMFILGIKKCIQIGS